MGSVLLVPIHLDALPLDGDRTVVTEAVDYSRLPFTGPDGDRNASATYLSESIVDPPFHDQGLVLTAGVHLHWALPDALVRSAHDGGGTTFPAVPTRWLVTRSRAAADGTSVPEQHWVVESDHVAPAADRVSGVAFPFTGLIDADGPPFRSVGRVLTLADRLRPAPAGAAPPDRLDRLTAAGYGHPAFAAVYPNCRTLFGFHDPDRTAPEPGLQYDVIGWYGRPEDDHLRVRLRAADDGDVQRVLAAEFGWAPRTRVTRDGLRLDADLWDELHTRGWLVAADDGSAVTTAAWRAAHPPAEAFGPVAEQTGRALDEVVAAALGAPGPERTVCFGRVRFDPAPAPDDRPGLTLAVGNSAFEAVAAYLADAAGPERAADVEQRLAAVLDRTAAGDPAPDVNARLAEARHERTFHPVDGESRWTISTRRAPDDAGAATGDVRPALPDGAAAALAELNELQVAVDRLERQVDALRRQVFADWYRYLLCRNPPADEIADYPDPDLVRAFVESRAVAPLDEAVPAAARLTERRDAAVTRLERLLDTATTGPGPRLTPVAGPRYYRPAEPVVLLVGEQARPSPRYGRDGELRPDGMLETTVLPDADPADPVALWERLDAVRAQRTAGPDTAGLAVWRRPPWHPVLLEWEVRFLPRTGPGGTGPDGPAGDYPADHVTAQHQLDPGTRELAVRPGHEAVAPGAQYYTGTSILTPSPLAQARSVLAAYLVDLVLRRDAEAFFAAVPLAAADRTAGYLRAHVDLVTGFYSGPHAGLAPDDPVADVVAALARLDPDLPALTQALSGFNDALLAQKQTTQMPVADPLGFADDQPFTSAVRDAVGRSNRTAPMPLADFNPIRAGAAQLTRLRIVDSFGQVRDVTWDRLVVSGPLVEPGDPLRIGLPPRIVQPARVNLRWLAADAPDTEAGAAGEGTPICGWLLPDHLDAGLAVYDRDGTPLGQIDQFAAWLPAPGAAVPVTAGQIHDPGFTGMNPHLRAVVARLTVAPDTTDPDRQAFLTDFVDLVETTLDMIEPDAAAQQQSIALLFGRPLAVVRARVDLQLAEPAATSPSWSSFDQDLRRATRDSRRFTGVRFPITIGAPDQYDDGVVGYWKGTGDTFAAAWAESARHPRIVALDGPDGPVVQAVDDPPQDLTILLDPRGSVHATSGVLPTKAITVPPEQFTAAMSVMEVAFLTAPLLTARDRLRIALPSEPGHRWSWLAQEPSDDRPVWVRTPAEATIGRAEFLAHFPSVTDLWAHLLDPDVRWLSAVPDGAVVLPPAARRGDGLRGDFAGLEEWVDRALGVDPAGGTPPPDPVRATALAGLPDAAAVWAGLCAPAVGWLTVLDDDPDRAAIVAIDQRPGAADTDRLDTAVLSGPLAGLETCIDLLLDAHRTGIAPMRADAGSTGPQEVREGWLALRPAPAPPDDARTR